MSNKEEITNNDFSESDINYAHEVAKNSIEFSKAMKDDYLKYLLFTVLVRTLPDVRDGLKTVHRRVLWGQHELKNFPNKPYKKSARLVGDVIGKYHPHGDNAVYDTIVRMAQPFTMRIPMVDGQGNFGSIDGDNAAAMRYTEQRQSIFSNSIFDDIEKDVVSFEKNYDETEEIPQVLPAKFPNLVINGSEGIATAIATYIPSHNPIEAMEVVKHICNCEMNNFEVDVNDLVKLMPAPDFPTGGLIHGSSSMIDAFKYGKAKMKLRAKWEEKEIDGKTCIVINEIPHQIKKEKLIYDICEKTTSRISDGVTIPPSVEGVSKVLDFSDKNIELVIFLKSGYDANVVFNQLCTSTGLETSINYNINVLVDKVSQEIGLHQAFNEFIKFRKEVIVRRTNFMFEKAKKRQLLLNALLMALENIDDIIALIKGSKTPQQAVFNLIEKYNLEKIQAEFIVDTKLSRLTSVQTEDIKSEFNELNIAIEKYQIILGDEKEVLKIIIEESDEQIALFNKEYGYGDVIISKRRSDFVQQMFTNDKGSMIKEEESFVVLTENNYILRLPVDNLDAQNRGTRGKKVFNLKNNGDTVKTSLYINSHKDIMLITDKGNIFSVKAFEIPTGERPVFAKNVVDLKDNEKIIVMMEVDFEKENSSIAMITKQGFIKKTSVANYIGSRRKGGIIGISLKENDEVVFAGICDDEDKIFIINSDNRICKFESTQLRNTGRNSVGVIGMRVPENTHVIGGGVTKDNENEILAIISENGLIKLTYMNEYNTTKKGGKGVNAFKHNEKTGKLFKALLLDSKERDVITCSEKGVSNRVNLENISVTKRFTSGVKFVKVDQNDRLADAFVVPYIEEKDDDNSNELEAA